MKYIHFNTSRKVSRRHLVWLVGLGQIVDGIINVFSGTLFVSRFGFEAAKYLNSRRIRDAKKI